MYRPYVSISEYAALGYDHIDVENLNKYLVMASRHVDNLTFNRIVKIGFENLTDYQRDVIQQAVCEHAAFLYDNADAIDSILSGYSINGVSMTFGDGANIRWEAGLPIQGTVYKLIEQSGLCCRLAR